MTTNLLAFTLFAIAASATPGPNNAMVAASAASHGIRATVPHMLGINLGFAAMMLIVGMGLAGPLAASPQLHAALRWVGGAWMIWIAVAIARSAPEVGRAARPPMGVLGAALFQWINPKAWVLAVAATASYVSASEPAPPQVAVLALVFALVGAPSNLLWALVGAGVARVLRTPGQMRAFNLVMAAVLVVSVLPLLAG